MLPFYLSFLSSGGGGKEFASTLLCFGGSPAAGVMGAQASKAGGKAETAAEKPGEAAASPAKTNGQVKVVAVASWGSTGCMYVCVKRWMDGLAKTSGDAL